jgi:hypothetical protein
MRRMDHGFPDETGTYHLKNIGLFLIFGKIIITASVGRDLGDGKR